MRILYSDEKLLPEGMTDIFEEAASLCVENEGMDPEKTEISMSVVSKQQIRELNRIYRGVDRDTDVLSFPMTEDFEAAAEQPYIMLGDVVICMEKAKEQAEEYGHTLKREIVYLFVHSVFHLLGYDHMSDDEKAEMRACEEGVMAALGLERNI